MIIDSHQHFWNYDSQEFGWIENSMSRIRRDFLPADLLDVIRPAGVDAVISVQARTKVEETRWLLGLAESHDWIAGVVGWVPMEPCAMREALGVFAAHPKLLGVREVMQGRPPGALLDPEFNSAVADLKDHGLAYDLLIFASQLDEAIRFVNRHADQTIVLDHLCKPRIRERAMGEWADQMRELAKHPNVFCKVSGMVTEADPANWEPDLLKKYFNVVAECFSPARLMFGSDWPVCLVGVDYGRWTSLVREWTAGWSVDERADFFARTACRAYRIPS
jgi:L-fuconolactonase